MPCITLSPQLYCLLYWHWLWPHFTIDDPPLWIGQCITAKASSNRKIHCPSRCKQCAHHLLSNRRRGAHSLTVTMSICLSLYSSIYRLLLRRIVAARTTAVPSFTRQKSSHTTLRLLAGELNYYGWSSTRRIVQKLIEIYSPNCEWLKVNMDDQSLFERLQVFTYILA